MAKHFINVDVNEHGTITGIRNVEGPLERMSPGPRLARSAFKAKSSESRDVFFALYDFVQAKLKEDEQWKSECKSYVGVYGAVAPDLRRPSDSKERTVNRIAKSMRRLWAHRIELTNRGEELEGPATPNGYNHTTYADRLCAWLLKIGASYTPPNGSDVSQDDRPLTAPAIGPGVGPDLI